MKNKLGIIFVIIILIVNIGFSYKLLTATLYGDTYDGFFQEISKLIENKGLQERELEQTQIAQILSNDPDIEEKYLMAFDNSYAYYSNSKFVLTYLTEGNSNDTLNSFIKRENWSDYEILLSNIMSMPPDRNNIYNPIPDYLIYKPVTENPNPIWYVNPQNPVVSILSDPSNPNIPSNFEAIFYSNNTGTVVYKIQHANGNN
jgi:hypothetical protein